jgi:glycosyltransferase involved in cell wall biosynthesis
MRICMVLNDPQEFGGLEEYMTSLAIGLQQEGHFVSVFSATWVSQDNQYYRRLRNNHVPIVQLPKWLSYPASHWRTKLKILAAVMWLFSPLTYLLGTVHFLVKHGSWRQSITSAHGWLGGQLLGRFVGPDRRKPLARLLLNWWQFRWHPDLLHIQGYTDSLLFVIDWASTHGVPVIYEEHQTPDSQFDWWQDFQQSINKAALVVAVSDKSAEALRTVCGVTRPIIVRNPLLADPRTLGMVRNAVSRDGQEPMFVTTVARLYVTKGLKYLLEAIVKVKSNHPKVQFKVYGDGPLRQELFAYSNQLGLDGNSIFVGAFTNREELSQIMAKTDIFVMSSILEGQPLSVVEAMAYGCPIVATSVGGIPELIEDGVNGLLCPPGDSDYLAQKILTLIENPGLRKKLGCAARKSYEQSPFQPSAVSKHFDNIYREVLQQKGLNS